MKKYKSYKKVFEKVHQVQRDEGLYFSLRNVMGEGWIAEFFIDIDKVNTASNYFDRPIDAINDLLDKTINAEEKIINELNASVGKQYPRDIH